MRWSSLAIVVVLGCGTHNDPDPVIRKQPGENLCADVCSRLSTLADGGACEEAKPIPLKDGGELGCTEFCIYTHDNGVAWNTDCLMRVQTCEQIESACNTP